MGNHFHLSDLLFFLVVGWGRGVFLDHFELLYSNQGVVRGDGCTADHKTRIALSLMIGAAENATTMEVLCKSRNFLSRKANNKRSIRLAKSTIPIRAYDCVRTTR